MTQCTEIFRQKLDATPEVFTTIQTSGNVDYYFCMMSYFEEHGKLVLDLQHNPDIKADLWSRFDKVTRCIADKTVVGNYKFDMKINDKEYIGLIIVLMTDDYAVLLYDYPPR